MTFPHAGYSGRMLYLDEAGREWGRESFSATVHPHGRTLRALCEMDDARLHRDVNWSVGPDWTPRDGFVRNMRDGQTIGSCWYRVVGHAVECEGWTLEHGRIMRRMTAASPIGFLGMHPLTGDCSIAAIRGTDEPGVERLVTCAVNSLAVLGDEGLDVQLLEPLVAYVGPEPITIGAGTFDAQHYTIRWSAVVPDLTDFWISEPDYLPLLTTVMGWRFEMVELQRS